MKNSYLITCLILLSTGAFAQKSGDLLVGESFYSWREGKWDLNDTSIYSYDQNNTKISLLHHRWNHEKKDFVKYFKHVYSYNAAGKQTLDEVQKWQKRKYVYYDKYECVYDAKNNKIAEMGLTGEEFVNHHKNSYTYDENNNVLTKLVQELRFDDYENGALFTYTYDSDNRIVTELLQFWDGSAFANYSNYIYTYSRDNVLAEMLHQRWDEEGNSGYNDYERILFTYDGAGNLLAKMVKRKQKGVYEDREEWVYTYDSRHNMTSELWRSWYEGSSSNTTLNKYYYAPKK